MLFLVRHADAIDAEDDARRPLSARGRAQVTAVARFLQRGGVFLPQEIWHSPLDRARETARLFAQHLALKVPLTEMPDLQPEDDPVATMRRVQKLRRPLAICGHEPHLSSLASLLVAGESSPPVFVMKKCSVLALDLQGAQWAVRWHVSPELIVS